MIDPNERQQLLDLEHLRLLRIAYLILGGTYTVGAVIPIFYVGIGLVILFGTGHAPKSGIDPRFFGLFFIVLGLALMAGLAIYGGLQLYTARCLRLRSSRTVCLVTAMLTCLMMPLGTAIGIFTFIVLGRPSVQAMFAASDRATLAPREPPFDAPRPRTPA